MLRKITIKGQEKIEISRDQHGIPHVSARHRSDLFMGMGYCHAMDRGMQMILMRILGRGRACELLQDNEEMLAIDIFFRKMNFYGKTDLEIAKLSSEAKISCKAYCDGVNKYFEKKIPWELRLLGYTHNPWKIEDSLLLSRMTGYLTLAQSQYEIERLIMEMVKAGISLQMLEELFPGQLKGLDPELIKKVKLTDRLIPEKLKWNSIVPRMMASNNWVVAPHKSKNGKAMLANDPHLETNRLPNIWYEIVLKSHDNYAIAATMPGLPGILIGRTKRVAWGATYAFMDAIDSWIEYCKEGKYLQTLEEKHDYKFVAFKQRQEAIHRKKNPDYIVSFYENEHGVLDGEPTEEGYYLATRWSCSHLGAQSLNNMMKMWHARTAGEAMKYLGNIETAWNWVLADSDGNIAYQMSGLCPLREEGYSGLVPLPGWHRENNWKGFVAYKDLPRITNPDAGFFVTANQNLNEFGNSNPCNVTMAPYRAERISNLLEGKEKLNLEDMQRIQYDVYSIQAKQFMQIIKPLLPDTPQAKILKTWDHRYTPESKGAYLFEQIYRTLFHKVFGEINLGKEISKFISDESGIFADFYLNFDRILLSETSLWFQGRQRDELYREVINRTLKVAPKSWQEKQKLTLTNIFWGGKLPRFLGFDKGPVVLQGGRATPHQGQIYRSGGRDTSFTPSFRFVTDFSNDSLYSNMAGGPSDRFMSRWYCSDLKNWLNGTYKTLNP